MAAASPTSVMPPSSFKEDVKSVGYWFYNLVGPTLRTAAALRSQGSLYSS